MNFFGMSDKLIRALTLLVVSLITPILVVCLQSNTSHQIESVRTQVAESEMKISRNRIAASLIEPLTKGSERECLTAMIILESVDIELSKKIFTALAQYDPSIEKRLQAIGALGRTAGIEAKSVLASIEAAGQTAEERNVAILAKRKITFREKLRNARIWSDTEAWEVAARNYYEASKYVDRDQVDITLLEAAKSYYEHGGFKEAVFKYEIIYSKFYQELD